MSHHHILKGFEYSIPGPLTIVGISGNREFHSTEGHLPLAKIKIDFENRILFLEVNSLPLMPSTLNPEMTISATDKERIRIKATFYSKFDIDLFDVINDALVFLLKGIIWDPKNLSACSGLLVLDSSKSIDHPQDREWHMTLYINDDHNEGLEIKLKLPICVISENAQLS